MKKTTCKILVVEDEPLVADRLEMLIEKAGHELTKTVDNSKDALQVISERAPDLILMDINIDGDYDGIELADMIREEKNIPIIFITSLHDDHTFRRISRTNPMGYLVKPFSDIQLQRSIDLVFQQLKNQPDSLYEFKKAEEKKQADHLFIKKGNKLEKVKIADIYYLEADGRYCLIKTAAKKFLVRQPLKEMHQKLDPEIFIQVHRSYVVNINKVESIDLDEHVIYLEKMGVPLSRREKEQVIQRLNLLK